MSNHSKNTTAVVSAKESNKPLALAIGIMISIALFVANFAKGQPVSEHMGKTPDFTSIQDMPRAKDPCPPSVSQIQKPSRPIGTNGAYVECNPNIIINPTAGCRQEDTACHGYYVSNESAIMYTGWNMFTCGALFLIIGFLIGYLLRHHTGNGNGGGNGNSGSGHTNTFSPTFNPTIRVVARTGDTVDFMVTQEKNPENKS